MDLDFHIFLSAEGNIRPGLANPVLHTTGGVGGFFLLCSPFREPGKLAVLCLTAR